jgi:curli production assembly/transport component CsgG
MFRSFTFTFQSDPWRRFMLVPLLLGLSACSIPPLRAPSVVKPSNVNADAILTPATRITRDLVKLPMPENRVPVAVYGFRDQTGQFKSQPESNLSNAVTQGAASILVKSLLDSGWFLPIEREGLQNLLNERRVAKAIETPADKGKPGASYPQLIPAQFILEGGIVGYESNVRTGGQGANLLGIGAETKYQIDQVTVNLRSVDVMSGQVVNSVSVTKTIFSHELSASVYKFVDYKQLLQMEGGYSTNEPSQLAVKEAIETAVIHLVLQGVRDRAWALQNENDWTLPLVQAYMRDGEQQLIDPDRPEDMAQAVIPMRKNSVIKPTLPPLTPPEPPAAAATPPAVTKPGGTAPNNPLAGATPKPPERKPSIPAGAPATRGGSSPERAPVNGPLESI